MLVLEEIEFTVLGLAAMFVLLSARYIYQKFSVNTSQNKDFSSFQRVYLIGYLIVMFSDALQGPYLYRLLHHYQLIPTQIAALYVCSFMSSMIFGPFLGGLADRYGRKVLALVCCVINALAISSLMSTNMLVLMCGRVLSGLAMSMLFSTFESWYINQHLAIGFDSDWISRTLSLAALFNGIIAVLGGLLANVVTDWDEHNPKYPFLLAVVFLIAGFFYIRSFWVYDAAQTTESAHCSGSLKPLVKTPSIWKLGLVQSFYEGATYFFAFFWTPALDTNSDDHVPLGFIFASFMLASVSGTLAFRQLVDRGFSLTRIMNLALGISTISLIVSAMWHSFYYRYLSFIIYQLCCGVYFPTMGTLRSEILPDQYRTALMSWFRAPLNLLVVGFLLTTGAMTIQMMILICAFTTFLALCCNISLIHSLQQTVTLT